MTTPRYENDAIAEKDAESDFGVRLFWIAIIAATVGAMIAYARVG